MSCHSEGAGLCRGWSHPYFVTQATIRWDRNAWLKEGVRQEGNEAGSTNYVTREPFKTEMHVWPCAKHLLRTCRDGKAIGRKGRGREERGKTIVE